ncbi:hypothetical protein V2J09_008695 [Rumex salicifolius]
MDLNKIASESGPQTNPNAADHLITAFVEITSATADEALFFLESHNFDLDAAVSTFLESTVPSAYVDAPTPVAAAPVDPLSASPSPAEISPSASLSPSRSRSPSPASRSQYNLRSRRQQPGSGSGSGSTAAPGRRVGGIRTFSDLNRSAAEGSDSDSDQPSEYYTGGEKSGMLVQDPRRGNDVDSIFDQARQFGVDPADAFPSSSSSRSFTGRGRLLSGETVAAPQDQPPQSITHTITFWQNGFTVDDGPLRMIDDPANASFLESIRKSECPRELEPADRRTTVGVNLARKDQNFQEPERQRRIPFQGSGRTLGSSTSTEDPTPSVSLAPASLNSAPTPSIGLVVDSNLPTTSIQLRLADGTRMVSRFNLHHTIREIRAFIDASRPCGKTASYNLQTMGFPPKQLSDLDQTIDQAGLANSVIIQRL